MKLSETSLQSAGILNAATALQRALAAEYWMDACGAAHYDESILRL